MALKPEEQLKVVLSEGEKENAEMRMYIEQYSPKLTAFGTLLVAVFTFAFDRPGFDKVFVMLPYFMGVILLITISQAYMITIIGAKIREIEVRICDLNGGVWIATWESRYAKYFVYPPFLKVRLENGGWFPCQTHFSCP